MRNRGIFFLALLGSSTVWAQAPQLEHRAEPGAKPVVPAPLKVPQKLETAHAANCNGI